MRDFEATKDTHEREEEEAERLVRKKPKIKPPRHDRRRERMDVDSDPDLDGDPDLSLNYKSVGGSIEERVASLYIRALSEGEEEDAKGGVPARWQEWLKATQAEGKRKVPNPNPETAQTRPEVSFSTALKDKTFFGKAIKEYQAWAKKNPEEESTSSKSGPKEPEKTTGPSESESESSRLTPAQFEEASRALHEKSLDPHVKAILDSLVSGPLSGIVRENPDFLASKFIPEKGLLGDLTTVKEVANAWKMKPSKKEPPAKKAPKTKTPPKEEPKTKTPPKEEPKEEEPAEEKPSKKEEKPKWEDLPRPEVNPGEKEASQDLINSTFPPTLAKRYSSLHPKDQQELAKSFQTLSNRPALSPKELDSHLSRIREGFTLNPEKVLPPKTWRNASGVEVALDSLPPEEQIEAVNKHRMQVVAMNLANRRQAIRSLRAQGLPSRVARDIVDFSLKKPKIGKTSKEHAKLAKEALQESSDFVKASFIASATSKDPPFSAKKRAKLAEGALRFNLNSQKAVFADLQASDYREITQKYTSGSNAISEHDSTRNILFKLREALDDFQSRAWDYPQDVLEDNPNPARLFRERVLAKIEAADPEKAKAIREVFAREDASEYEGKARAYKRAKSRYSQELKAYDKAFQEWQEDKSGKKDPPELPREPKAPAMPKGYLTLRQDGTPHGNASNGELKRIQDRLPDPSEEGESKGLLDNILAENTGKTKSASASLYSSYHREDLTMGASKASGSRSAIYHGVEPYPKGETSFPSQYPGWEQANQSELGEKDYAIILTAAREWLKAPVLSQSIEGMEPDARFRAALDLAIREAVSSKYSGAVNATTYNHLLAKLGGGDESGSTIRKASLRREARLVAQKVAATDPSLAYEILDLSEGLLTTLPSTPVTASKTANVPVEDTYEALRSALIRTASTSPQLRQSLKPVLSLIKTIDEVRTLRAKSND